MIGKKSVRALANGSIGLLLAAALGCGGPPKVFDDLTHPSGKDAPTPTDMAIELEPRSLTGVVYSPDALGRPNMPLVEAKKKLTLDKQRAAYKAAKPGDQLILAQVLATQLYQQSKKEVDDEKEAALLDEARSALRDARDKATGGADLVTLQMLGVYEFILAGDALAASGAARSAAAKAAAGKDEPRDDAKAAREREQAAALLTQATGDFAAAEAVYGELVQRFPESPELIGHKTWRAWAQLRQGKHADALATLAGTSPGKDHPEAAFVLAWAQWGAGDAAAAWTSIAAAAAGWTSTGSKPAVDGDVILFAARTGADVDEAVAAVSASAAGKRPEAYAALYSLANALAAAGRYADASTVIDRAIALAAADLPKEDPPKLRFQQAKLALPLDSPEVVAAHVTESLAAVQPCGAACTTDDVAALVRGTMNLANLFHTVFATAQDPRYYQPAHDLYAHVASNTPDAALKAEAEKLSKQLDDTKAGARATNGTHDASALAPLLSQHDSEITACLEGRLVGDHTLSGKLGLVIEFDAGGAAKGATTEPAGGQAGIAAVASCVEARARTWRIPARSTIGTTKVTASYQLAPR